MRQKLLNDKLYVFQTTPYNIVDDIDQAEVVYVQEGTENGFRELNADYADKIQPKNYLAIVVRTPEWAPYVNQHDPEPTYQIFLEGDTEYVSLNENSAEEGETVYIYPGEEVDMNEVTITIADVEVSADLESRHWSFTMPGHNVTANVSYSGSQEYMITLEGDTEYVSLNENSAEEGETVYINPNGPEVDMNDVTITITDVEVSADLDERYWSFTMPGHDVTVNVSYSGGQEFVFTVNVQDDCVEYDPSTSFHPDMSFDVYPREGASADNIRPSDLYNCTISYTDDENGPHWLITIPPAAELDPGYYGGTISFRFFTNAFSASYSESEGQMLGGSILTEWAENTNTGTGVSSSNTLSEVTNLLVAPQGLGLTYNIVELNRNGDLNGYGVNVVEDNGSYIVKDEGDEEKFTITPSDISLDSWAFTRTNDTVGIEYTLEVTAHEMHHVSLVGPGSTGCSASPSDAIEGEIIAVSPESGYTFDQESTSGDTILTCSAGYYDDGHINVDMPNEDLELYIDLYSPGE